MKNLVISVLPYLHSNDRFIKMLGKLKYQSPLCYCSSFLRPNLYVSVDCEWSEWSSCSQTCGPAQASRSILISAEHGGQNCTGARSRYCNAEKCPGKIKKTIQEKFSLYIKIVFVSKKSQPNLILLYLSTIGIWRKIFQEAGFWCILLTQGNFLCFSWLWVVSVVRLQ